MNIWAFLFYSWITFGFGRAAGKGEMIGNDKQYLFSLLLWSIIAALFIYMGWYQ